MAPIKPVQVPTIQAPPPNQAAQATQDARRRDFMLNVNQAQNSNDVVNGTFLVNNHSSSVLFDTGADRSFITFDFECILAKPRVKLSKPFSVEVANGSSIVIDSVICNCTLTLNKHRFSHDLIPMKMGSFDVIVGMDWLSLHHTEILCFEKYIRIPLPNCVVLNVYG
ncbi:uncharacterized protein LOC143580061 [Bidens hawaiensis]|uniref:uncharacterized protein LOC143580061 n=1 Tax=Bidens hawaiensis TaxID=980011 RepID=UPI00404A5DBA